MEQIRKTRGVPAKRGGRIYYRYQSRFGTIVSTLHGYLRIRLDGDRHTHSFHPTWKLDYLDDAGAVIHSTGD